MKRTLGFKPEYYSRNGFECIWAKRSIITGKMTLISRSSRAPYGSKRKLYLYGVWVECDTETGCTDFTTATRFFDTYKEAIQYAKQNNLF